VKKQAKVAKVMREFRSGDLKSSSGQKVTNPKQAIAIGLSEAGLSKKMASGGHLKEVDAQDNPGLAKLPTEVRNKMGYAKKGGLMKHSDMAKDKPMMKKIADVEAKKVVKGHEKKMHGMKKGGMAKKMASGGLSAGHKSADGCVTKGRTKGKMITMKKGGAC
jgi:hypothetical protein